MDEATKHGRRSIGLSEASKQTIKTMKEADPLVKSADQAIAVALAHYLEHGGMETERFVRIGRWISERIGAGDQFFCKDKNGKEREIVILV